MQFHLFKSGVLEVRKAKSDLNNLKHPCVVRSPYRLYLSLTLKYLFGQKT